LLAFRKKEFNLVIGFTKTQFSFSDIYSVDPCYLSCWEKRMKFENLKSCWFAGLLMLIAVGLSGCCSDRCFLGKAFGQRHAVDQVISASPCGCDSGACGCEGAALAEYHSQPVNVGSANVGSATRTAAVSSGSSTKNCGST